MSAKLKSNCTNCFKSLGVHSRMEIYKHLCEHTQSTVSELVTLVGLTQPTISYHLKEMKEHGILKSSRNGKEVYYSVSKTCPHYEDACVLSFIQFPKES